MKKIVTILMCAVLPVMALAQNSAVDKVFAKYADVDGFTVVTINKGLLNMVADIDEQDAEAREFLGRINQIKVLATEDDTRIAGANLYDEVLKNLDKSQYEELMTVKSKDEDVLILAKKSGEILEELIILVGGEDDNALVYISGKMSMKDLSKLSKSVNIEGSGLEHLKDVGK